MNERTIMTSSDIDRSLERISMEILEKNHGAEGLAILGIHTGGVYLAERIREKIRRSENISLPLGSLDITLYRDDWSLISQHPIVKKTGIDFALEDLTVILIDDVIFTGRTIRAAMDAIMDYGRPQAIQLAALVDRGERELPIQPDYVGQVVEVGNSEKVDVLLREKDNSDRVVIDVK